MVLGQERRRTLSACTLTTVKGKTMSTNTDIKRLLRDAGLDVYSCRKQKRMIGGQRYNFHGGLRQGNHPGRPEYFYRIDLLSTGHRNEEDYRISVLLLRDAGYLAEYHSYRGLTVTIRG